MSLLSSKPALILFVSLSAGCIACSSDQKQPSYPNDIPPSETPAEAPSPQPSDNPNPPDGNDTSTPTGAPAESPTSPPSGMD